MLLNLLGKSKEYRNTQGGGQSGLLTTVSARLKNCILQWEDGIKGSHLYNSMTIEYNARLMNNNIQLFNIQCHVFGTLISECNVQCDSINFLSLRHHS